MNSGIRFRLFLMMFLEFFIWGAWFPLIFGYLPYLKFSSSEQSWILNTFPVSALLAMFFSNQFADRHFAAERFVAVSHLIGGLSMLGLAFTNQFWPFFILMFVHCAFYVPTISITNSIAFAAMKDAQQEFGIVRMGGTIGWIAASWPFVFLFRGLAEEQVRLNTYWTFLVAGVASLALAAFSLTLPHTPPKKGVEGEDAWAFVKAVKLLALPFLLVLWIVTFVDAAVHQCYFSWTERFLTTKVGISGNWVMPVMSIGQIAEIVTMAILGLFLKKLGWRTTMILGIMGHAVRFAVFAFCPNLPWLVVAVNVLHGICYAFFFATVYIFVDEYFPKDVRSSAQGLFNLMILGIGPMVANSIGPRLFDEVFSTKDAAGNVVDVNFQGLFLVPCVAAIVAACLLACCFWPPRKQIEVDPAGA